MNPPTSPRPDLGAKGAAAPADPPIRDAATVVVVDRSEPAAPRVLMGMRGAAAAFMPSKYVFPGGAVDPDDSARPLPGALSDRDRQRLDAAPRTGAAAGSATPATAQALAVAAIRELAEETGLLLGQPPGSQHGPLAAGWDQHWPAHAAAGLVPDASGLIFGFRAITPPGRPRRFDARFFLIDASAIAGDITDFSRAEDELSHLHWVPLTEARRLDLPFITEVVLAELAALVTAAGSGPLARPDTVPFFDNAAAVPGFRQLD